jgi:uncharacterized membrane-anchored protein YjiN (DUF445 family)
MSIPKTQFTHNKRFTIEDHKGDSKDNQEGNQNTQNSLIEQLNKATNNKRMADRLEKLKEQVRDSRNMEAVEIVESFGHKQAFEQMNDENNRADKELYKGAKDFIQSDEPGEKVISSQNGEYSITIQKLPDGFYNIIKEETYSTFKETTLCYDKEDAIAHINFF